MLQVVLVVMVLLVVVVGIVATVLLRRAAASVSREAAGLVGGLIGGQSGADAIAQHAGDIARLEGMAERFGVHMDLPDALGTKVPGTGMAQPTQGTLHVVGRSAPDARAMRAPCTIAYAIESPGVPAFSGEQVFEVSTAQWPEPNDTLPCLFDSANPAHVDIVWQQVPSTGDKALGDAQALANELNQQPPT